MNFAIPPIIFSSKFNYQKQEKQKIKEDNYNQNPILSHNQAQAYKNQILFKGNIDISTREEMIKNSIDFYELGLKPQTLDFIFSPKNAKEKKFEKYSSIGQDIFSAYFKAKFHENYPHKFVHELRDLEAKYGDFENKSRILRLLFPSALLQNGEELRLKAKLCSRMFSALLGAMVLENPENGTKNALNFLDKHVEPIIVAGTQTIDKNYFEEFQDVIEKQGKDFDDVYIQRIVEGNNRKYTIYYKDLILARLSTTSRSEEYRERAVKDAMAAVESGVIDLNTAKNQRTYIRYNKPSKDRIRKLNFLQEKYGLNFKDMKLLNQAFLFGVMPDNSTVLRTESNQPLEHIGAEVLKYCINRGYRKYHPETPEHQIKERVAALSDAKNIAAISKNMSLWKYTENITTMGDTGQQAGILRALIGAIFVDNKENGFEEAFNFIDKNLSAEFFGAQNVEVKIGNSTGKTAQKEFQKEFNAHKYGSKKIKPQQEKEYVSKSRSRREAIFNTLSEYDLKISPETLSYVFSRDSLDTERFDRYKNIGKLAYAIYARKNLYLEYPFKNALQATKIEQDGRSNQISKTLRAMFDKNLYKDGNPQNQPLSSYFFALLGAIIEESEDGFNDFEGFLNNHLQETLNSFAPYQAQSEYEALNKELEKLGINPDDIFIETKFFDNKCENKVFYQGRFLTKINTPIKNGMHFGQEAALREAIVTIKKSGIGITKNKPKENIDDYRHIDKFRKVKLEKFAKAYGLEFSDYNLLNRVFLFGKTAKGTQIQYHDSYENIEYIGDAILEYCVHKILTDEQKGYDYQTTTRKLHRFTRNSNLAKIGTRMKFDKYILGVKEIDIKRYADMFEALIAAIYLDGGKDGLDNAYRFINDNFRDEILNMSGKYEPNY
ncbi:MAG: hypothetical protein E7Z88_08205 [Cyanobacteria bacterium SIG27]|nr:hypothetical protein [Cyanobacteria bacterium SIG27]